MIEASAKAPQNPLPPNKPSPREKRPSQTKSSLPANVGRKGDQGIQALHAIEEVRLPAEKNLENEALVALRDIVAVAALSISRYSGICRMVNETSGGYSPPPS